MFDLRPVLTPYPGLRPFEPHESEIFFGAETQTDRLLEILQRERFLAVIGPSGGGKSSLVRAGLLPGLASGALGTGSDWRLALLRPGGQPLLALAQALLGPHAFGRDLLGDAPLPRAGDEIGADAALIAAELRGGLDGLRRLLARAALRRPSAAPVNLLILVDQFEELFTYRTAGDPADDAEAGAFVDLLLAARAESSLHVYVTLTMRTDFLGDCVRFADLPEAINRAQYLTPRLNPADQQRAICGPAQVFGGSVDADFAAACVARIAGNPDQLPLLQHALARWWRVAESAAPDAPSIDAGTTQTVGDVSTALDRHAESLYAALTTEERAATEALFRAITEGRSGDEAIRRPQRLAAIAEWTGLSVETLRPLIETFAAPDVSFVHYGPELTARSVIDLTHEALIRQWQRLGEWVASEHQRGEHYRRWSTRASEYAAGRGALLVGGDLARALDWWNQSVPALWIPSVHWAARYSHSEENALSTEFEHTVQFVAESRDAGELATMMEQKRLEATAESERKRAEQERELALQATASAARARRMTQIAAAIAIIAIAAAVYAGWKSIELSNTTAKLEEQRDNADSEKNRANEEKKRAEEATDSAMKERQFAINERERAQQATEKAEAEQKSAEEAKKMVLKSEKERTRDLYRSMLEQASLLAQQDDFISAHQLLKKSVVLDSGVSDELRHKRNLLAGYVLSKKASYEKLYTGAKTALVGGVAVGGETVVAAGERGTVVMFDEKNGRMLRRFSGHDQNAGFMGAVRSVAFSRNGGKIYSAGEDNKIICKESLTGNVVWEVEIGSNVRALALSPDDKFIAVGDEYGVITLMNAGDGAFEQTFDGHTQSIAYGNHALRFSADSKMLASASDDFTARIWQVDGGLLMGELRGHSAQVEGVAFSPDGKNIATVGDDGKALLWNVEFDPKKSRGSRMIVKGLRALQGHRGEVIGVTFVENGRMLVTSSMDGTARLWDVDSGTILRVFQGHEAGILGVAAVGKRLFTASSDGTVRRWLLGVQRQLIWPVQADATSVAIAPDAKTLAVGLSDGVLQIYSISDGRLLKTDSSHDQIISRIAYSPDGQWLATASGDQTIRIYKIMQRPQYLQLYKILRGYRNALNSVVFSSDGKLLAVSGYDGRVGLVDIQNESRQVINAHRGAVSGIAFGVDKILITVGVQDHALKFWDVSVSKSNPIKEWKGKDELYWAAVRPDGKELAVVGRDASVALFDVADTANPIRMIGHANTVLRAIYSPDGQMLATASADMTVRVWDMESHRLLFTQRLPTVEGRNGLSPVLDFDFRCTAEEGCVIAAPLTMGRVVVYPMPYEVPPPELLGN